MTNLESLHAKKDVLMPAVRTSRRKIFVFEFINCANVPPYGSDAPTLLTLAAYESEKEARHALAILCRTVNGRKFGRWLVNKRYEAKLKGVVNDEAEPSAANRPQSRQFAAEGSQTQERSGQTNRVKKLSGYSNEHLCCPEFVFLA